MKQFIRRVIKPKDVFNERNYELAVKSRWGFQKKGEITTHSRQRKDD